MTEPFGYRRSDHHERRRGRHRNLRWLLVVLLLAAAAAAVALVYGVPGGETYQTAARPAPSASAAPVTTALEDVSTVGGERVTLRYRVDVAGADTALVTLVIAKPDGTTVRKPLQNAERRTNVAQAWTGAVTLKPGSYRYYVRASVGGRAQKVAVPAKLVVTTPVFPERDAIDEAISWIKGRGGTPGLAVVTADGKVRGVNVDRQYASYSLAKAMILVAYLREHGSISAAARDTLTRMIESSDNAAADAMYAEVGGGSGLASLAKTVGMKRFSPGGDWISARVTPADQARFFLDMETYIPAKHRAFAGELLSGITARQRWGIVAAAGPLGWKVYFKGGWSGGNVHMVQAARLVKGDTVFALAIMTEGNPNWTYGFGTLKGATGVLLGQEPTGAYLTEVLE